MVLEGSFCHILTPLRDYMEKREDFFIPEDVADWIGLKKSEYLSNLIEKQPSDDLKFEEFHLFDGHIQTTIENPDKAFEYKEDDQVLRVYVRTYVERVKFHQVVIGVLIDDKKNKAAVFVPILCLVSKSDEVVREFCKGEVISRPTLN